MPKEYIQTERIQHEPNSHDRLNCACSNEIVISWGRGAGAILLGVGQKDATPGEVTESHYTDLNTSQIDHLIKVLRRAKRQLALA